MMSFGGEAIDNRGVIREFPALSMMTGLIGNALGWDRAEADRHARLQARLIVGCRIDRPGMRRMDFQTARLAKDDRGWTTFGVPEGREGGAGTYDSPHLRYRDYHCDASVLVALRLEPSDEAPTLEQVAAAFDRPARPLFIGRKSCLPAVHLRGKTIEADTIAAALAQVHAPRAARGASASASASAGDGAGAGDSQGLPAFWPQGEGEGHRTALVCDERNWHSGVHGGLRPIVRGLVRPQDRS